MKVHFCGVRGSTPAPGLPFVRYGGHTSSVAIAHDNQTPTLVLDAGTGLRRVTDLLDDQPFDGTILLGHLHWDHVHGMPFFKAGGMSEARANVWLPSPDGDPVDTLARGMSPPHFPVGPRELGPGWTYSRLDNMTYEFEGFTVTAREIPHKGGQTFGFRVTDGTSTIAYLSDHAPLAFGPGTDGLGALHDNALELADGVDLLIHDAQFLASEFPAVAYLGHASIEYAVSLGEHAGARQVACFHHSPARTDSEIDQLMRTVRSDVVGVQFAAEGTSVHLTKSPALTKDVG